MKKFPRFPWLLVLLLLCSFAYGQGNNVIVTVQALPPYSPYLSSYVDQPNKVLLILQNNSRVSQKIKLSISIQGDNGVSAITKSGFNPPQSIDLPPFGVKQFDFHSSEVRNYVDANNVQLTGITKSQIIQNQALPEGNYTICVQALDYVTGAPLSMSQPSGCSAPFSLFYIDPPMLVQPACDGQVTATNPQNIIFSWTPPATARGAIQYEFTLKEVPSNINPYDAIKNAAIPVLFSKTVTSVGTLIYGIGQPKLEDGKQYVWRVKCIDPLNNVQFKNGGYSDACAFKYSDVTQVVTYNSKITGPVPGTVSGNPNITLLTPPDNSVAKWIPGGSGQYGHYEFTWQLKPGMPTIMGYHFKFAKRNPGQTAEQAIQNPDMNLDDKSDVIVPKFDLKQDLPNGDYVWQVKYNATQPKDKQESALWTFKVAESTDTATFTSFDACGYTINVTNFTSKDLDKLAGTGYFYLYQSGPTGDITYGPKVDVQFNGISVKYFGFSNGKKTTWRMSSGNIQGAIKNADDVKLTGKGQNGYNIEGTFSFKAKEVFINADTKTYFDSTKHHYVEVIGDKGEGACKKTVFGDFVWTTPFTQQVEGAIPDVVMVGGKLIPNGTKSFSAVEPYRVKVSGVTLDILDASKFTLNGAIKFGNDFVISPDMPMNSKLTFTSDSRFNIVGTTVYAYLNGKFSIYSGNNTYNKSQPGPIPVNLDYTFENANSLLLPVKYAGTVTNIPLNKDYSVTAAPGDGYAILGDSKPYGYTGSSKGLLQTNFNVLVGTPPNKFAFFNALNTGNGFSLEQTVNGKQKIDQLQFSNSIDSAAITVVQGTLAELTMRGQVSIPFLNTTGALTMLYNYDGLQTVHVYLPPNPLTVFDDGANTIKVTPYYGQSTISMFSGYFTLDVFIDINNNNHEDVTMHDILIQNFGIKSNGDILAGSPWYNLLTQKSGNFNDYDYKIGLFNAYRQNNKYVFRMQGDLVLESQTLATPKAFLTTLSFVDPHLPKTPTVEEPDASKLTASADPAFLAAAPDNKLTVDNGTVSAGYSNGALDFNGDYKFYKGDPTFGNGFMAVNDITIYNPMEGKVHTKLVVGKKSGVTYWYAEAAQQDLYELPTGILDVVVYGFGGRFYYHMNHNDGQGNINNDDYVPDVSTFFGAYGMALIKTAGSNGGVLWGQVSAEISTTSSGGLSAIRQRGDVQMLTSGAGNYDGMITGSADLTYNFSGSKYFQGIIVVNGNVLNLLQFDANIDLHFGDDDWHLFVGTKQIPVHVNVVNIVNDVSGYFDIWRNGGTCTLAGGCAGSLFSCHPGAYGCVVPCVVACCCHAGVGANVDVSGSADASAQYPSLQLSGAVSLSATAGVWANACGIGINPTVGATLSGSFTLPTPFCVAGSATLVTPDPFPNISFSVKFKNGGVSLGDATCN